MSLKTGRTKEGIEHLIRHEGHQLFLRKLDDTFSNLNFFCANLFLALESGLGGSLLPLPAFSLESFELSEFRAPLSLLLLDWMTGDSLTFGPEAMAATQSLGVRKGETEGKNVGLSLGYLLRNFRPRTTRTRSNLPAAKVLQFVLRREGLFRTVWNLSFDSCVSQVWIPSC